MDEWDLENLEADLQQQNTNNNNIKRDDRYDNNNLKYEGGMKDEYNQNYKQEYKHEYKHEYDDRRDRDRRKRSRSRSRDRDRKHKKHSKRHNSRSKSPQFVEIPLTEEQIKEKEAQEQIEKNKMEIRELEEKFIQAQKEAEEAQREDLTVMFYCLPTKAKEKDVYKFIAMNKIGKIRDIRLIKDQRTGKSKGVCYVEFFEPQSIQKCLTLDTRPFIQDGKEVQYSKVRCQHSQAEKNRSAAAARQLKEAKAKAIQSQLEAIGNGPQKIYIGGLVDNLADITDGDLRALFEPFGLIDQVDVHRDPITKRCKGYAYITYREGKDAEAAVEKMNDYIINNRQIKVTSLVATLDPTLPLLQLTPAQIAANQQMTQNQQMQYMQGQQNALQAGELDEEHGGNFLHNAQSRVQLMQKLNRQSGQEAPIQKQPVMQGLNEIKSNPLLLNQNPLLQGILANQGPSHHPPQNPMKSQYLFIGNMFTGEEIEQEPTFFADLQEDVEEECQKFGQLLYVFIDVASKGNIYLQFQTPEQAQQCQNVMSQRYYNNQKIVSYFLTQQVFEQKVQNR